MADLRRTLAEFHHLTIREHGGLPTFRDEGVFEHAVARPWMTVFGESVYKTPFQKAAAIAEAIARGHPFNDGNHRTALAAVHVVLGLFGLIVVATDDDQRDAIRRVGSGNFGMEDYSAWLERWSVLRPQPGLSF